MIHLIPSSRACRFTLVVQLGWEAIAFHKASRSCPNTRLIVVTDVGTVHRPEHTSHVTAESPSESAARHPATRMMFRLCVAVSLTTPDPFQIILDRCGKHAYAVMLMNRLVKRSLCGFTL